MSHRSERVFFVAVLLTFLLALGLPYLYAARVAGQGYAFGGLLVNPPDGNTYLAKMRQGWRGEWLFTLPYNYETGAGALINLPYIFLGHLARWLGLPLALTFHAARLAAAAFLLWALYRFLAALFPVGPGRRWAFLLAAFGSGFGWLAALAGGFTPDLWVGEAYPFLGAYSNVHFPLGLGLQLLLLTPEETPLTLRRGLGLVGLAALLALVSAFSVPVVAAVWGGLWLWRLARRQPARLAFRHALLSGLGGGPVLLYDLWAIRRDPLLAGWSGQNVTTLPPGWELLVAFSPALLLALPGAFGALRRAGDAWQLPAVWALVCPLLAAVPFALQRRFLVGYFVPLAALAVYALGEYVSESAARRTRWTVFVLAVPTNVLLLLSSAFGAQTRAPELYLTQGERAAFAWLEANTLAGARLLAGPETGLFVPVYTDARVYYGHPFETVEAGRKAAELEAFYAAPDPEFLARLGAEYLFYGPRERALGPPPDLAGLRLVYERDDVAIYAVGAP
ncbi:MAG: hypothetical protein HYZ26_04635 [Chloroflexi bacterium]|nr:hypothetical protein [Chloroflexota bacterium]